VLPKKSIFDSMNLFRLHTLQRKAIALVVLFAVLSLAEFFFIRYYKKQLLQQEGQLELAQNSRLNALQLSVEVKDFLHGNKERAPEIIALMAKKDSQLKIFAEGGRDDDGNIELKPISRLSKITLNRIQEKWTEYKTNLLTVTTHEIWKDSVMDAPASQTDVMDSTSSGEFTSITVSQKMIDPSVARARLFIEGQWTSLLGLHSVLIKDLKEDKEQSEFSLSMAIGGMAIANILVAVGLLIVFRQKIIGQLSRIQEATATRTLLLNSGEDEFGKVSHGLNEILNQLNHASTFVQNIGDGNLEVTYNQQENGSVKNDQLASSLISMQSKLKTMNEEEQKRTWANEGLTRFVEILRTNDDNLASLGDKIVSGLVQYTRSNQGGLYILNDEVTRDPFLELISLYAFNIKKFEQQKLKIGEGLVGQAYLEKATIYLKEIPEDYIKITSGLGASNPKNILVVPLKVDTEVYGLVELASFNQYQPHEISFVEKLGETLASTLASVKTNQRNRKLLEESRMATEAMRAQEEEMRQNMEELTATQEEMSRKEREYLLKIKDLEEKLKKPAQGDDWTLANELEQQLQIQLEALKITQESLSR
jgi:hypothetical protein